MDEVKTITDENFESEVLLSDIPVLIDIWAPWCVPCKMVSPIVIELAKEYAGKIKVGKLNVDDNEEIPEKYAVMSIPAVLLFSNGLEVTRFIGPRPKRMFKKVIDALCD